jgi:PKHD-type hydroxylase
MHGNPLEIQESLKQLPSNDGLTVPSGGRGFLTQEECARLLAIGLSIPGRPARTGSGIGKSGTENRASVVHEIYPQEDTRWIFEKLEAALLELNAGQYHFDLTGFLEGAQLYEYTGGGYLGWHRDVGMGYMSNRKLSMTLQLSDGNDYEGGNLEFMDFTEPAPRGRGDLTVFPAFLMHRVTEVTHGARYSFVSWVHGRPFR